VKRKTVEDPRICEVLSRIYASGLEQANQVKKPTNLRKPDVSLFLVYRKIHTLSSYSFRRKSSNRLFRRCWVTL